MLRSTSISLLTIILDTTLTLTLQRDIGLNPFVVLDFSSWVSRPIVLNGGLLLLIESPGQTYVMPDL